MLYHIYLYIIDRDYVCWLLGRLAWQTNVLWRCSRETCRQRWSSLFFLSPHPFPHFYHSKHFHYHYLYSFEVLSRRSQGQTSQCKEESSIDSLSQPLKMRVPRAPRGVYSAVSSSNSSLSSSVSDPQRGSTSSNVRKRNYIIFDENDEDTLI